MKARTSSVKYMPIGQKEDFTIHSTNQRLCNQKKFGLKFWEELIELVTKAGHIKMVDAHNAVPLLNIQAIQNHSSRALESCVLAVSETLLKLTFCRLMGLVF